MDGYRFMEKSTCILSLEVCRTRTHHNKNLSHFLLLPQRMRALSIAFTSRYPPEKEVTMTIRRAQKILLEKINARVFCQPGAVGGGNPVTIFASRDPTDDVAASAPSPLFPCKVTQQQLARTCSWESVMVDSYRNHLYFYMPTGEEVSFCAHAAMGGTLYLKAGGRRNEESSSRISSSTQSPETFTSEKFSAPFDGSMKNKVYHTQIDRGDDIVTLKMETTWEEQPLDLQRYGSIMKTMVCLEPSDATSSSSLKGSNQPYPHWCNSSILRPKTLVHVPSLKALNEGVLAPSIENDNFRTACDTIDSTGLYLYSERQRNSGDKDDIQSNTSNWECRQFPRASGYPEDPATGIAAAALALSLEHRRRLLQSSISSNKSEHSYNMYQGAAMGKPSLIMVKNIEFLEGGHIDNADRKRNLLSHAQKVSFQLVGKVDIDSSETIEVESL